jgi:transglutaminase-like putative cysteine protease
VAREYRPGASNEAEAAATTRLPPATSFYAVRAGSGQVGLASITMDTVADGLRVTSRSDVDVPLPLVQRRLLSTTDAIYDRQLRLRSFSTTASGEAGQPAGIALAARRILGAGPIDGARATAALATWVRGTIQPGSPTFNGVEETLRRRRGDSSDRAALFVALARSIGIPARPVAGLLVAGGRFRYRAWAEVWLGGWVPVDPTLGQFPADPGHVRLLTHATARPAAIVSLLGAIRPTLLPTAPAP